MESGGKPLPRSESNRTLFEIIREEGGGSKESKKSWKSFKSKLHRKNSGGRGSAWTSTVAVPASDIPLHSSSGRKPMARQPSSRINSVSDPYTTSEPDIDAVPNLAPGPGLLRRSSLARESPSGRMDLPMPIRKLQREYNSDEDDDGEEEEEESGGMEAGGGGEDRPVRMSLMSLLAESDKDGFEYGMDDEDEDEEEEYGVGGGGIEYNNCCVCMVRHKGTPFVPCGHSFCRLCSRELCVQGGNCPLCNNYILEILDIF